MSQTSDTQEMENAGEAPAALDFESALVTLQGIVGDLESGDVSLDQSLQRFEEGIRLLRQCYQYLDHAEQRIEELINIDTQGNCSLAPFDATATVDKPPRAATKAAAPKRSTRAKTERPTTAIEKPVETAPEESDSDDLDGNRLF